MSVPRASLAQEAACVGRGAALPARHAGPPEVPPHQTVSDSVAQVIGHLLDAMLHWSDQAGAGASPEPVHQMRVATRRLRSALSIFKHVAAGPELDGLGPALKDCAARLGAARDWDVFLEGAGARLAAAAPDDPRCAAMLGAARRRRTAAYAELRGFLGSPEFRGLQVALGCTATLRPWEAAGDACVLHADTAVFAADVLARRLKRVRTAGRGLAKLPIPALHELRKDCKRLRYAAEFFAPLFAAKPAKRFIQRLSGLQDELGLLNDAAAISGLMAQLGRTGQGYAAGMVAGVAASASQAARDHIGRAWKRFRAAEAFWSE